MKKIIAGLTLGMFLFTGCSFFSEGKLATVNGQDITQKDFDKAYEEVTKNTMFEKIKLNDNNPQNEFVQLMLKERIMNELIVKTLLNQEIEKRGIKVEDKDIENEIKEIKEKIGGEKKFEALLVQNNTTLSEFKKNLREELKFKKLINTMTVINVSDKEVSDFYKENVNKFIYPDQVRASHILIKASHRELFEKAKKENPKATVEELNNKVAQEIRAKKEKALEVLKMAKADKSAFGKLAKEYSEDTVTAANGGDLGFFGKDDMVEEFSKNAFAQKPNFSPELVQTMYGYHIVYVTDRKAAGQEPFNKVEPEIKMYLTNMKQIQALQKLVDGLKNTSKIEFTNASYNPVKIQEKISNLMIQQQKQQQSGAEKEDGNKKN